MAFCSCERLSIDPDLDPSASVSETFNVWPEYTNVINYNFAENKEEYVKPTSNLPYANYFKNKTKKELTMEYTYGSWSYFAGPDANSKVKTDTVAVRLMLEQLEEDATYLREVMGWPPTFLEKKGYRKFAPDVLHPKTKVTSGVCAEEAAELMKNFFKERR